MKTNYRNILQRELETRKLRNPSYNLSSFARFLKIHPSRLSEILRGKVGLSISKASSIASILHFSDNERSMFLDLVCAEHGRNPKERKDAQARIEKINNDFFQYDLENFKSVADWHHHAIIEIIALDGSISNKKISEALGIDLFKTNQAIDRLIKLNLIEHTLNGYRNLTATRQTPRDIPSDAIKKLNEQVLTKAMKELHEQEVGNRDYSIVFLSFNKEQLQLAKERIRDFRRSFMKEFEGSIGKDSVYCMAVQMFELTQVDYSHKIKKIRSTYNDKDHSIQEEV